jgi:hypothetical protein
MQWVAQVIGITIGTALDNVASRYPDIWRQLMLARFRIPLHRFQPMAGHRLRRATQAATQLCLAARPEPPILDPFVPTSDTLGPRAMWSVRGLEVRAGRCARPKSGAHKRFPGREGGI